MYSIIASNNNISQGVNFYLVDTIAELKLIKARPGTKAYVLEDSNTYIMNHKKNWYIFKSSLVGYVDIAIEEALKNFTGDIDPELIKTMINDELNEFNWSGNEAFRSAVNEQILEQLQQGNYVTEKRVIEIIKDNYGNIVMPDLDLYLKKEEAQKLYVRVNDYDEENIIYVTGVTINDI